MAAAHGDRDRSHVGSATLHGQTIEAVCDDNRNEFRLLFALFGMFQYKLHYPIAVYHGFLIPDICQTMQE